MDYASYGRHLKKFLVKFFVVVFFKYSYMYIDLFTDTNIEISCIPVYFYRSFLVLPEPVNVPRINCVCVVVTVLTNVKLTN